MDHLHSDGSRPSEIVTPASENAAPAPRRGKYTLIEVTELAWLRKQLWAALGALEAARPHVEADMKHCRARDTRTKCAAALSAIDEVLAGEAWAASPDRSQANASEVAR